QRQRDPLRVAPGLLADAAADPLPVPVLEPSVKAISRTHEHRRHGYRPPFDVEAFRWARAARSVCRATRAVPVRLPWSTNVHSAPGPLNSTAVARVRRTVRSVHFRPRALTAHLQRAPPAS